LSEVLEKIAAEIEKRGGISFARFMEMALYCPVYGYYEKERDIIGTRGDFYTSPAVGQLFGQLLSLKFADWIEENQQSKSPQSPAKSEARSSQPAVQIIEAGAHRGQLAADILKWMRTARPELFEHLEYCIVEPSPRRCEWQRSTLKEFAQTTKWFRDLSELSPESHGGSATHRAEPFRILFCNELLDAMPVHRLGWDAGRKQWFEWGVASQNGQFAWTRMELNGEQGFQSPTVQAALQEVLPDGFTTEICPTAVNWWRQAAAIVKTGKLVAIDYGLTAEELFVPERVHGTLRGYREHQLTTEVLENPVEQDLTAHVNFSAIREAGESAGLVTEAFVAQEQFLGAIVAQIVKGEARFGEWTPSHTRQFRTLTHPDLMGHSFKVLIQSRTKPEVRS
jgi:SAM-dependent MidA family methyltransferase